MRRADCQPLADHRRRQTVGGGMERAASPAPWELLGRGEQGGWAGEDGVDYRRELRRRVLAYGLHRCLTPAQREAVELCCGQGLSVTQAAARMQVAPSTASRRLSAALNKLRALAEG